MYPIGSPTRRILTRSFKTIDGINDTNNGRKIINAAFCALAFVLLDDKCMTTSQLTDESLAALK